VALRDTAFRSETRAGRCAPFGAGERRLFGRAGTCGGTRFLHVAGTNGKGSTCAMLAAVCGGAGLRTGLVHLRRIWFRCGNGFSGTGNVLGRGTSGGAGEDAAARQRGGSGIRRFSKS
jgi:hypothetical protein